MRPEKSERALLGVIPAVTILRHTEIAPGTGMPIL